MANEKTPRQQSLYLLLLAADAQRERIRQALLHAMTRNHGSSESCDGCALIDSLLDEPAP